MFSSMAFPRRLTVRSRPNSREANPRDSVDLIYYIHLEPKSDISFSAKTEIGQPSIKLPSTFSFFLPSLVSYCSGSVAAMQRQLLLRRSKITSAGCNNKNTAGKINDPEGLSWRSDDLVRSLICNCLAICWTNMFSVAYDKNLHEGISSALPPLDSDDSEGTFI